MGYPHPDYLLNDLTSAQLSEWEAYNMLDPIGKWRDDFMIAQLTGLVYNMGIQIHGKKGTKLTEYTDFMPEWDAKEPKRQSTETMKELLLSFADSHNKKLAREKRLHQNAPTKKG